MYKCDTQVPHHGIMEYTLAKIRDEYAGKQPFKLLLLETFFLPFFAAVFDNFFFTLYLQHFVCDIRAEQIIVDKGLLNLIFQC